MSARSIVLAVTLVACGGSGGTRDAANPTEGPAEGAASPEAVARAFVEALDRGDGAAAARLFPSEATLRGMCEGDPAPLVAHIHGYRDRELVPGVEQMAAFEMSFVSADIPARGDSDDGWYAIAPGQSWLGPWNDEIDGHACRVTRPVTVVIGSVTLATATGGEPEQSALEITMLEVDGRWYLIADAQTVPRQLTDEEVERRMYGDE